MISRLPAIACPVSLPLARKMPRGQSPHAIFATEVGVPVGNFELFTPFGALIGLRYGVPHWVNSHRL